MAFTGSPIFDDPIEAWERGPVVPTVFRAQKYGSALPPAAELDESAIQTLHWVAARYGALAGSELVAISHEEDPWIDAQSRGQSAVIPTEDIKAWFAQFVVKSGRTLNSPLSGLTGVDELPEIRRRLLALSS